LSDAILEEPAPPRPRRRPLPFLEPAAAAAALSPLAWLGVRCLQHALGPDPIDQLLAKSGHFAIWLLLLCLACTPLQFALGLAWPLRLRKLAGNFAFAYASLHLLTFVVLDQGYQQGRDLPAIGSEIWNRKFIFFGIAAWLVLLPLALTSTPQWQARLGQRRWKSLHRIVYLAGTLAVAHFFFRFRSATLEPLLFLGALILLFAARVYSSGREPRERAAPGS